MGVIMARARNIKPAFFKNETLVELPFEHRLLFVGLWTLADRDGKLEDRPKRIKMEIFPADDVNVEQGLCMLCDNGFIQRYEAVGQKVIVINNFTKHQSPHHTEKNSELPDQDGTLTVKPRKQDGGNPPESLFTDSLNPDSLQIPPNPQGGAEPETEKPKRVRKDRIQLKTFIERCTAAGEKPISEYSALLTYCEETGLPMEFVSIAWDQFKREFLTGHNSSRLQADWRRHFLNYVTKGYYRLWYAKPGVGDSPPTFELSTTGLQAKAQFSRGSQ